MTPHVCHPQAIVEERLEHERNLGIAIASNSANHPVTGLPTPEPYPRNPPPKADGGPAATTTAPDASTRRRRAARPAALDEDVSHDFFRTDTLRQSFDSARSSFNEDSVLESLGLAGVRASLDTAGSNSNSDRSPVSAGARHRRPPSLS